MADRSTFVDDSGETRLAGTIGAPDASAAEVLTADGAGGTSWAASGGSSAYTDALLVRSTPVGVTFAGNVNKIFAPGDLTVVATIGSDISLVDDGFGNAAFQTVAGGDFQITATFDVTLTQDAGSALQRVLQCGQGGLDTQRGSGVNAPIMMVDGIEVTLCVTAAPLLHVAAGGIFGAAPSLIPNNSIAADSYYAFFDSTVVRLAPLT